MTERSSDPHAIELAAFCRQGQSISGSWPLIGFARLAAGFSAVPDGEVSWSASGSLQPQSRGAAQLWLELKASALVPLECQRCLQTLAEPLRVERRIRFVGTEEEAARLDEASEDDVLLQPSRLDLQELLEDELILSLPLVPRHPVCPQPLAVGSVPDSLEGDAAPHPFAALAAWRKP